MTAHRQYEVSPYVQRLLVTLPNVEQYIAVLFKIAEFHRSLVVLLFRLKCRKTLPSSAAIIECRSSTSLHQNSQRGGCTVLKFNNCCASCTKMLKHRYSTPIPYHRAVIFMVKCLKNSSRPFVLVHPFMQMSFSNSCSLLSSTCHTNVFNRAFSVFISHTKASRPPGECIPLGLLCLLSCSFCSAYYKMTYLC